MSAASAPSYLPGPLGRIRWAAADGWTVARRDLAHWVREPTPVVMSVLFPVMITLVFGYLMGGAMKVPGGDYFSYLMPGMFAMQMLSGVSATMLAVTTDASRGVTDRFRSMPMAPSAVLVGRSIADLFNTVLVLAALLACGLAVGWRPGGTPGQTVVAIGLLLLLRFAFIWLGIYLGLVARSPAAAVGMQAVEFPIAFLSSAFVSPGTMPPWLGAVAEWNPLSSTLAAIRDLFANPGWAGESWVAQHGMLMAVVWPLALIAVFFPLSVRRFRNLSR